MDQLKDQKLPKVKFDHSKEEIFFADIAEINATAEAVKISFATQSVDGKTAKVSHSVYITLGHFIRLTEVCQNVKNNIVTEVEKKTEEIKKGS